MRLSRPLLALAVLFVAACTPPAPTPTQDQPVAEDAAESMAYSSAASVVSEDIVLQDPKENAVVTSPVTLRGEARGPWFFEGSFPVQLIDNLGNEIATGVAQADGEWMTEDFVPFTATITFSTTAKSGGIVLKKDNPSGEPENDASVTVPVRFVP